MAVNLRRYCIGVVLCLSMALAGCGECEDWKKSYVYFFVDVTDSINYQASKKYLEEDLEKIASLFSDAPCHSAEFQLYVMNERSQNAHTTSTFKGYSPADNQRNGKASFKKFTKKIQSDFEAFYKKYDTRPGAANSQIYRPLCKAFHSLLEEEGDDNTRRLVILYSDMLEHSDCFSFYRQKDGEAAAIMAQMAEKCDCELPDLSGIEVHIISTSNAYNNKVLQRSNQFWEEVFTAEAPAQKFRFETNLDLTD